MCPWVSELVYLQEIFKPYIMYLVVWAKDVVTASKGPAAKGRIDPS